MKREERREKEGMRRELLCSVEWAEGFYSVVKKFGNYLLIRGLVSVGTFLNIQVSDFVLGGLRRSCWIQGLMSSTCCWHCQSC